MNGNTIHEYTVAGRGLTDDMWMDKLDAATELEAMIAISINPKKEPDGKDKHIHYGVKEWEYRDTMFKVGERMYSGKVNIKILDKKNKNGENMRLLYDITGIKEITDEIHSLIDESSKAVFNIGDSVGSLLHSTDPVKGGHGFVGLSFEGLCCIVKGHETILRHLENRVGFSVFAVGRLSHTDNRNGS